MKRKLLLYNLSTGLLSLMILFSAGMYFFNNAQIVTVFQSLGYPAYIVYPLAILKILGLAAIWTRVSTTLVYFAYAGFLFDFVLAFFAHMAINDGEQGGAVVALALWIVSFLYYKKLFA